MVRDINPGSASSMNDLAYFYASFGLILAADNGVAGSEPWQSNGTTGGTSIIADVNPSGSSAPEFLFVLNERLLFSATDGDSPTARDLYRLDLAITAPVTLLDFTATPAGRLVQLRWTTSSEINSSHFEIQRSVDGKNFQTIGTTAAAINSSVKRNYYFEDGEAFSLRTRKIYYRLKSVDLDQTHSLSTIKSIQVPVAGSLVLYPNPVRKLLTVTLNSRQPARYEISIVSHDGREIYRERFQSAVGVTQRTISVDGLPAGTYYLRLIGEQEVQTQKFIKQ